MHVHADPPGAWRRLDFFADFFLCPAAVAVLCIQAGVAGFRREGLDFAGGFTLGLLAWSIAEYLIHRFVLHAVPLLRSQHARHHAAPRALVGVPAWVSASLLLVLLTWARGWAGDGVWACGIGSGLVLGYLAYVALHYATHHLPGLRWTWLARLRRAHALHHARATCNFGVSTGVWDRMFGTAARRR